MNMRETVAIGIILVGLASAVWQIDRMVNNSTKAEPMVSVFMNAKNDCLSEAVWCATEEILCESTKMTIRMVGATVKSADNFVRFVVSI